MLNNEPGLYPSDMEETNVASRTPRASVNEITVNEILKDWENFPGLEPAFVTHLRVNQLSRGKNNSDTEALLPPGVE